MRCWWGQVRCDVLDPLRYGREQIDSDGSLELRHRDDRVVPCRFIFYEIGRRLVLPGAVNHLEQMGWHQNIANLLEFRAKESRAGNNIDLPV